MIQRLAQQLWPCPKRRPPPHEQHSRAILTLALLGNITTSHGFGPTLSGRRRSGKGHERVPCPAPLVTPMPQGSFRQYGPTGCQTGLNWVVRIESNLDDLCSYAVLQHLCQSDGAAPAMHEVTSRQCACGKFTTRNDNPVVVSDCDLRLRGAKRHELADLLWMNCDERHPNHPTCTAHDMIADFETACFLVLVMRDLEEREGHVAPVVMAACVPA